MHSTAHIAIRANRRPGARRVTRHVIVLAHHALFAHSLKRKGLASNAMVDVALFAAESTHKGDKTAFGGQIDSFRDSKSMCSS